MAKTQKSNKQSKQVDDVVVNENPNLKEKDNSNIFAIILTVVLVIIYFVYSLYSKGVYQHDEMAHYLSMSSFFDNPNSILSNWSKTGYKLIYVLPSLLGLKFVYFINCIVAAFSVYLTYDILKRYNSQYALLAIVLLGLSPMWFQLSFRNYAEFTCVLMTLLALRSHQREKFIFAALFISYASFIRQELFLVNGLYFLYLCYKKQFVPALLSGTFAIVTQVWGYLVTGNMLYLYDYLFGYMSEISGMYLAPRGLQRIPVLSGVLFGGIISTLFIVYLGASALLKKHLNYIILIPFLGLYTYYAIGDAKFLTGVPINTRQLVILTPFLTIFAILGIDRFQLLDNNKKKWMLSIIVPYILLVWLYMSKEHNWVALVDEDNYTPLIVSSIAAVILFLPIKLKGKMAIFSLIGILSLASSFKKFEETEEDKTMKRVAGYYKRVSKSGKGDFKATDPVYSSHVLFEYHQEKPHVQFLPITDESVKGIKKGSVIFWDSHYSYRPKEKGKSIKESYFTDRSYEYRMLNTFVAKDRRVKVVVFYKYNESDTFFEDAVALSKEKKFKESIPLLQQSLSVNPKNSSTYYYLGLAYQNTGDPNLSIQNYSNSLQINPNNQESLFNRGALYANYGKFNEALTDMNNYVKLNTQNANAYLYLGNIYLGLKKYDEAIKYYEAVLKFNSNFADAHYNIGIAKINKNDKTGACVSFNKAKTLGGTKADEAIATYCK